MKRNGLTKLLFVVGMAAGLVIAGFYSCEKQSVEPKGEMGLTFKTMDTSAFWPDEKDICGDLTMRQLIRSDDGRTIGEAVIYNDLKYMYVLVHLTQNFYMKNVFMHAGKNNRDFPTWEDGELNYSAFRYEVGGIPLTNVRIFKISLEELRGKSYFSVIAQVRKKRSGAAIETAWVEGRRVGTEGMIFLYNRNDCLASPVVINQIVDNE